MCDLFFSLYKIIFRYLFGEVGIMAVLCVEFEGKNNIDEFGKKLCNMYCKFEKCQTLCILSRCTVCKDGLSNIVYITCLLLYYCLLSFLFLFFLLGVGVGLYSLGKACEVSGLVLQKTSFKSKLQTKF